MNSKGINLGSETQAVSLLRSPAKSSRALLRRCRRNHSQSQDCQCNCWETGDHLRDHVSCCPDDTLSLISALRNHSSKALLQASCTTWRLTPTALTQPAAYKTGQTLAPENFFHYSLIPAGTTSSVQQEPLRIYRILKAINLPDVFYSRPWAEENDYGSRWAFPILLICIFRISYHLIPSAETQESLKLKRKHSQGDHVCRAGR